MQHKQKIMAIGWIATAFATLVALTVHGGLAQDMMSRKTMSTEGGLKMEGKMANGNMNMNNGTVQSNALAQVDPSRIIAPPAPKNIANYGISESKDYQVEVNGKPVHVYTATIYRVGDYKDGPKDESSLTQASFVSFDFSGTANLKIISLHPVKNATLRPLSAGVVPKVQGNTVSFALNKPRKLMLEINGEKKRSTLAPARPLFVFTNPIETNPPKPGAQGVTYFGPGIHHIGHYQIKSNETVYIAGGAVVEGTLFANGAQNIKILGHGILDGSQTPSKKYLGIDIYNSKNVLIDGPIIRDSPHWTIVHTRSENVTIRNVKILNHRINGEGLDISNSRQVRISDSFIYASDDSISVKGCTWWHNNADQWNAEDVTITDSTLMSAFQGFGIRVGDETRAPELKNLTFRNIDFYGSGGPMAIINGDRAMISDVRVDNWRVERYIGWVFYFIIDKGMYSVDPQFGRINNLDIRNINVMEFYGEGGSNVAGHDAAHPITNVLFQNVKLAGKPLINIDQIPGRIYPLERPVTKNFVENLRIIP
ncbi:MAG: hypothetical protein DSM106950_36420 [Stigonema ocellatum SAG 48.90 = DSM 106950]|nr:hypothetical protein [Stigonema ocellatum SAG 48.90 = DSM 106950]